MTIAQLKLVADQKGLAYGSKIKKQELIDLINDAKKEASVTKNSFKGEY